MGEDAGTYAEDDKELDALCAKVVSLGENYTNSVNALDKGPADTLTASGHVVTHILLTALLAELSQARKERRGQ